MNPRRLRRIIWRVILGLFGGLAFLALLALLAYYAIFSRSLPAPTTLAERLATFPNEDLPLQQPVTIYWNENQIPFIEAQTDDDLAFTLGLVQAHLRLWQIDLLRRVPRGRLSEIAGPLAVDLDLMLRLIDITRAVPVMEANLPADTRKWIEQFVSGVNYYQEHLTELPHEYQVLGMELEPWTVADVLAVSRLISIDVTWLSWFQLLPLRERPDWPELWRSLLGFGSGEVAARAPDDAPTLLAALLRGLSRSGSNTVVIAAQHSATGAALIANDPHLGISLPNLWMIVGVQSPGYHAVGLMPPGLPFLGIGRNPDIAWGGTNMRAASSDLVDLSHTAPGDITERQETIRVRWWPDKQVALRESPYGPVFSDAPLLDLPDGAPFALRWLGHEPSDEVTAFLKINRAHNWDEFVAAFDTYAVSGMNMLYADRQGNIGHVLAVKTPARSLEPPADLVLDFNNPNERWQDFRTPKELPLRFNPPEGFLASSNNRPDGLDFRAGYFFAPEDRISRLRQRLSTTDQIGLADLRMLQRDVFMSSAVELRDALLARAPYTGDPAEREILGLLRDWDGQYRAESVGALAFELFLYNFAQSYLTERYGEEFTDFVMGFSHFKPRLAREIGERSVDELAGPFLRALRQTAETLPRYGRWGAMHRLAPAHYFANLPLLGERYRGADYPADGSVDTLQKTAHELTDRKHTTHYGAQARHISDLGDPDANYFALLGGQDGRLGSDTFADQLAWWRKGEYIRVPLQIETVREEFTRRLVLLPADR